MKIGFIGLGLMGSRMANNLLKEGHELYIYNRTKEKAESLIEDGAKYSETPAELAQNVDILITMLSSPEAVDEVAIGESGFLYQLTQKALWIDCSTVNPSFSKQMAVKANGMNVRFLDAPVAGTIAPAEKGELIFFVGGEEEDVKDAAPLFDIMGKKFLHLGKNGMGTSMKMVVNLILGQAMAAFSEGMILGQSLGLSKQILFDTLLGGPVTAPFLAGKKGKIEEEEFEPEFPLELMKKDFQLASISAYENNVPVPLTNLAKEIYSLADKNGLGKEDFSAIYKFLNGKENEKD